MNLTTKRTLGVAAAVALAFGSVVATTAQAAPKTISLAWQNAITGGNAGLGADELLGAETALYEYNKTNPAVKVNLVKEDDVSDAATASSVALSEAQNPAIVGVLGSCCSGATKASFPAWKSGRLPVVSMSATNPALTDPKQPASNGFPFFHRVVPTDALQGVALARYAVKDVSSPKVYYIDDQTTYGAGLRDTTAASLKAASVTIVGKDTVAQGTADYSPTASKIVASGANVVIYFGYYADAAKLKKAVDLAGYKGVFASGDGTLDNGYITQAGATDANGTLITAPTVPFELAASAKLLADFTAATGVTSPAGHAYVTESYDSTNVFLQCIKEGDVTRASIENCLQNETFSSVKGSKFSFTRYGDVSGGAPVGAFAIKNGAITYGGNA
jgi:branched-chain amino acid transport system substrate-binding protein